MLFYGPLLLLTFGKGLDFIFEKFNQSKLVFVLICAILFLSIAPISSFVHEIKHPFRLEETRPILNNMMKYIKPGDKIYVYYGAKQAFEFYYRTKFHHIVEKENIIWGKPHRNDISQYSDDLSKYLYKDLRIWIVFSHYRKKERASIFNYLEKRGRILRQFENMGTVAYLFKIQ